MTRTTKERMEALLDRVLDAEARAEAAEDALENSRENQARSAEWTTYAPRETKSRADLPDTRLQIQWERVTETEWRAVYSLVRRHYVDGLLMHTIGCTRVSGGEFDHGKALDKPFRDGVHILWDMVELRLPGFVLGPEGNWRQLHLSGPNAESLPKPVEDALRRAGGGA